MTKKWKAVIAVVIALIVVTTFIAIYFQGMSSCMDYWAQNTGFNSIDQTSDHTIRFVPPHAHGYPDSNVAFTDVAFALWINGTQLQPNNFHLKGYGGMSAHSIDEYVQISKGVGPNAAAVFYSENCSYILTFTEDYKNGHIDNNDLLTLECTRPFAAGTNVTMTMFVDIDGTWGVGQIKGTFITG